VPRADSRHRIPVPDAGAPDGCPTRATDRGLLLAVVLLVAAATLFAGRPPRGPAAPFAFLPGETRGGFYAVATSRPVLGIAALGSLRASAAFVVDRAEPAGASNDAEVVAVRAVFPGAGRTANGYRRSSGYPAVDCAFGPPTGFGSTYPVEGLRVAAGDDVAFIVYGSAARPGDYTIRGVGIGYTFGGEHRRAVSTDQILEIHLVRPGQPLGDGICRPGVGSVWARP
jgi:hypothetical protein